MDQAQLRAAIAQNDNARNAIVQNAMPVMQPIPSQTVAATLVAGGNNTFVFNPKLVGLWVGFLVKVTCTITNAGAAVPVRTNGGAANIAQRIQFTDLNNQTRINTNGYHLALLNSMKNTRAYGGAVAPNLPMNVGNVWTVNQAGATIAGGGGTTTVTQYYYVPVSYSPQDLTGAINGQVINAASQLQITVNAAPGVVATDSLFAVYSGATAANSCTVTNTTVSVTQFYYNLNNKFALPIVDISRSYLLQDTVANSAVVANQDNGIDYANQRTFFSTFAVYDNAGVFNTGSDMTYMALQYANSLKQWQLSPSDIALMTRNYVGYDSPPGIYYFDHRAFPISSANFGNVQLVVNPSAVTATAFIGTWYEMVAQEQTIITASSLPSTGG